MENNKDLQNEGKYSYDKESAEKFSEMGTTFSINIFQWVLTSNRKGLKPSKGIVRVKGFSNQKEKTFEFADNVVKDLDNNIWDGRKTVFVK